MLLKQNKIYFTQKLIINSKIILINEFYLTNYNAKNSMKQERTIAKSTKAQEHQTYKLVTELVLRKGKNVTMLQVSKVFIYKNTIEYKNLKIYQTCKFKKIQNYEIQIFFYKN